MFLVRILGNALVMCVELALAAGVAYGAFRFPTIFAAVTGALAFLFGLTLERARLTNELRFYFSSEKVTGALVPLVGFAEAAVKGVLAGAVALVTFSGSDLNRLAWIAGIFAVVLYAGANVLRGLALSFDAHPARWGYFRLAAPLGILFSAGVGGLIVLGVLPSTGLLELGKALVWELPSRPSVNQVSDVIFLIKQYVDELIVTVLATFLGKEWARIAALVISTNALSGFVVSIYAVTIAVVVRAIEARLP